MTQGSENNERESAQGRWLGCSEPHTYNTLVGYQYYDSFLATNRVTELKYTPITRFIWQLTHQCLIVIFTTGSKGFIQYDAAPSDDLRYGSNVEYIFSNVNIRMLLFRMLHTVGPVSIPQDMDECPSGGGTVRGSSRVYPIRGVEFVLPLVIC